MNTDIYLIKALRAYRHVTYGQFDREDSSIVQETQDAADRIEELLLEVDRLKEKLRK